MVQLKEHNRLCSNAALFQLNHNTNVLLISTTSTMPKHTVAHSGKLTKSTAQLAESWFVDFIFSVICCDKEES